MDTYNTTGRAQVSMDLTSPPQLPNNTQLAVLTPLFTLLKGNITYLADGKVQLKTKTKQNKF